MIRDAMVAAASMAVGGKAGRGRRVGRKQPLTLQIHPGSLRTLPVILLI